MAKKKNTIPKDESKRDKFKRVFTPKMNKAVKSIRLLGNAANSSYAPTDDDKANILSTLRKEVESLESRLEGQATSTGGFSFD